MSSWYRRSEFAVNSPVSSVVSEPQQKHSDTPREQRQVGEHSPAFRCKCWMMSACTRFNSWTAVTSVGAGEGGTAAENDTTQTCTLPIIPAFCLRALRSLASAQEQRVNVIVHNHKKGSKPAPAFCLNNRSISSWPANTRTSVVSAPHHTQQRPSDAGHTHTLQEAHARMLALVANPSVNSDRDTFMATAACRSVTDRRITSCNCRHTHRADGEKATRTG